MIESEANFTIILDGKLCFLALKLRTEILRFLNNLLRFLLGYDNSFYFAI